MVRIKQIFRNLYKCFIKGKNQIKTQDTQVINEMVTPPFAFNDITEKWDRYGLMPDEMPYGEKMSLATKYERMATFLIAENLPHAIENTTMQTMLFPILCRVFVGVERDGLLIRNTSVSIVDLCDKFIEFHERNWGGFLVDMDDEMDVDYEAEFLCVFVDDYLNIHKYNTVNLVKKNIKKHKLI